ncbi:hypothetical protein [Haematobacter massiliensis]|uniref:hypothetical protein n=1 Tax=Haematobacter massiliensis TaxID=195105 RepID=UPI0023F57CB1|nr:hypothetical protein [Haematobacter massiliensis]
MKNIDPNFYASLAAARDAGLRVHRFVWFEGAAGDWSFGFWSGDEDISVAVLSGASGAPVTRTYYGGENLDTGDIAYLGELAAQTIEIGLSQIGDVAQEMFRGRSLRLARCELHEMADDPATGELAGPPEPLFIGIVDAAPVTTPAVGGDGGVRITLASEPVLMLSRTSTRRSSAEAQRRRGGDEFARYAGTVGAWNLPWGRKG